SSPSTAASSASGSGLVWRLCRRRGRIRLGPRAFRCRLQPVLKTDPVLAPLPSLRLVDLAGPDLVVHDPTMSSVNQRGWLGGGFGGCRSNGGAWCLALRPVSTVPTSKARPQQPTRRRALAAALFFRSLLQPSSSLIDPISKSTRARRSIQRSI